MAAQNEIGGYVGKILRVDLTNERISEEILDSKTLRKYVGGTALGAKYLYEEVPPGIEWSDHVFHRSPDRHKGRFGNLFRD
jgi:hypothetical protein